MSVLLAISGGATSVGALSVGIATLANQRASAADPKAQLSAIRHSIDAVANQYFAAQQHAKDLDAQLIDLRNKIRVQSSEIERTRKKAVAAAVSMYRSQTSGFAPTDAATTLDQARAELFAQESNSRSRAAINRFVQATASLRDAERRLRAQQTAAHQLATDLQRQGAELDAALTAAQRSYDAMLRAEAAAAAARNTTSTSPTNSSTNSGPGASTPTTRPSTQPTGATPNPTGSTAPRTTTTTAAPPPPPPPSGTNSHHNDPFLSCVRQRESRGQYGAVNPGGYYGAYQFGPRTWNVTASHAGRLQLIGVRPDHASAWDQDELAWVLYQWQGKGPWGGHCP